VHKWTGLIVGLNVLLLSVTAGYLLTEDIVMHAIGAHDHDATALIDQEKRAPIQPVVDKLLARFEGTGIREARVAEAAVEGQLNQIAFVTPELAYFRYYMDPYSGALHLDYGTPPPIGTDTSIDDGLVFGGTGGEGELQHRTKLATIMLELHTDLMLETIGTLIVGIVGILFLISTITGLFIYAPFMKAMVFGAIREGKGVRFWFADMHKVVGVTSLVFNFMMALTGVGLTLGIFAIQYYVLLELRAFEAEHGDIIVADPYPTYEEIVEATRTVFPEGAVTRVDYPGGVQGDKTCAVFVEPDPLDPGLVPTVVVVTAEASPTAERFIMPWWIKLILLGAPIHVGSFGGTPVRIAYLFFALTSGMLSISGFVMYFNKRRRKRAVQKGARAGNVESPKREPLPVAASTGSEASS
jgi:uncharacterized iron-regulated membrane protein